MTKNQRSSGHPPRRSIHDVREANVLFAVRAIQEAAFLSATPVTSA